MSVAGQEIKVPRLASFYGRSFPRATILLDDSNQVKDDRREPPPSVVAPLLDWAKKAAWKEGGSRGCGVLGKPPKRPFTPLYAFLAVKQQQLHREHPHMSSVDILALAKADAALDWQKLSEEEAAVYFELAEGDAQRYEAERARFEKLNPGYYEEQAAARAQAGGKHVAGNLPQPRAPLNAWRAFVQHKVQEKLDADPGLAAQQDKSLQLQISVMREAAPLWKALSEEQRQEFVNIAAEDKKRWQADLDNFPDFKALIEKRAAAKAAIKEKAAAKRKSKRLDPGLTAAAGKAVQGTAAIKKRSQTRLTGRKPPAHMSKAGKASKGTVAKAPAARKPKPRQVHVKKPAIIEEEPEVSEFNSSDSGEIQQSSRQGESDDEHDSPPQADTDQDEQNAGPEDSIQEEENDEAVSLALTPAFAATQQGVNGHDIMNNDYEDDLDHDLRGVQEPEELTQDDGTQGSQGLFGMASRVLMSGFKGVWASAKSLRKHRETPGSIPLPASMDTVGVPADALVGRTFIKKFAGEPYVGRVESYLPEYKWYAVKYTDGDDEELTTAALMRLLASSSEEDPAFESLQPGRSQDHLAQAGAATSRGATKKRKARA